MVSLTASSYAQDVTTWHYDNNRTGWQQNETALTTTTVSQSTFGKIMQYNVDGGVYAQPLALSNVSGIGDVVFIATEEDMLYAYPADYTNTTTPAPIWATDLAGDVPGGTFVDCGQDDISECHVIPNEIGVTGTPVIDRAGGVLYVVSLVSIENFPGSTEINYYLHVINYLNGSEMPGSPYKIAASATGQAPTAKCGTAAGNSQFSFLATEDVQRAGLLLLSNNIGEATQDTVYVAFSPVEEEVPNGWLLSYTYNLNTKSFVSPAPSATLNLTPHGTGGGIWMDGAGLAADGNSVSGTSLYVSTANGSYSRPTSDGDWGDSLLKLSAATLAAPTSSADYFTPADILSFDSSQGRCIADVDLGSGGVMLLPDSFFTGYPHLMVMADKESKVYVVSRDNLTGFNQPNDLIVQEIVTPTPVQAGQGYWGSPAYWEWSNNGTNRAIYYSVDATVQDAPDSNTPAPINMYELSASVVPITGITASTGTFLFCGHGGEPTVSSQTSGAYSGVAGTGIVWAIEASNSNNPSKDNCNGTYGPAVLHAFDASSLNSLYTSTKLTSVSLPTNFSTPMVFKGQVYVGTTNKQGPAQVDVFGLCGQTGQPSCFAH